MLTTHYMEEATELCDRVAIMDHGHILEIGTVQELIRRRFKERAVFFDTDRRSSRPRTLSPPRRRHPGAARRTARPSSTRRTFRERSARCSPRADERGVEPHNLGIRQATLEDVFLDLTGRALRD